MQLFHQYLISDDSNINLESLNKGLASEWFEYRMVYILKNSDGNPRIKLEVI